jgi:hypothetical protein
MFQLALGQKTTEAFPDGPRFEGRWRPVILRQIPPDGRDRKMLVRYGDMRQTAIGQAGFRRIDERPETSADGNVVQHTILRQQHGTCIQQPVQNFDVGNTRTLGCQEQEFDWPLTQQVPDRPQKRRCLAKAFVNNDTAGFHDLIRNIVRATADQNAG